MQFQVRRSQDAKASPTQNYNSQNTRQANIAATRRQVADAGLKIINLGSSANMHFLDSKKRQSNLDEAKKFIDLANQLACPFIRVFPNDLPKDQPENETVNAIIQGLIESGNYAKNPFLVYRHF